MTGERVSLAGLSVLKGLARMIERIRWMADREGGLRDCQKRLRMPLRDARYDTFTDGDGDGRRLRKGRDERNTDGFRLQQDKSYEGRNRRNLSFIWLTFQQTSSVRVWVRRNAINVSLGWKQGQNKD